MFQVQAHELVYVYASVGVGIVLLIALAQAFSRLRKERAASRELLKCRLCAFQFRSSNRLLNPRCPNCETLVDRKPELRL